MGKHWTVAIGINRYQHFQALQYAQQDAEALQIFLTQVSEEPLEQCLLLTELSPAYREQSTFPTRETLVRWVGWLCNDVLQPDDTLWLLFSGYGVHYEGEDYLLPWEAEPQDIPATAVSVRSLYQLLRTARTANVLVMLDINRNQIAFNSQPVGAHTAELADMFGLSTILSCHPEQFAHETRDLRQGFFTAALIEGLQSKADLTFPQLSRFLSDRLPELCDHHFRPLQTPVIVGPTTCKLYPHSATADDPEAIKLRELVGAGRATGGSPPQAAPPGPVSRGNGSRGTAPPTGTASDLLPPQAPFDPGVGPIAAENADFAVPQGAAWLATVWRQLHGFDRRWLLFLPVLLLLGFGIRTWQQRRTQVPDPSTNRPGTEVPSTAAPSPDATGLPGLPGDGIPLENSPANSIPADLPSVPLQAPVADLPIPPGDETAKRLYQQNFERLRQARALIRNSQASEFVDAIAQLRLIKPDEPFYTEAQQDIQRWSKVIYDLAVGRADEGSYEQAIAAARLVPDDQGQLYQSSQAAVQYWQQQLNLKQVNQARIDKAIAGIQAGSASSYNDAIGLVRPIQQGEPLRFEAQRLVGDWSKQIFELAQTRAVEGDLAGAIQAAQLVPEETAYYNSAQMLIQEWQAQQDR
ncbi:MAG: hypothetical protein AAGF24_00360 [Cyanobacteria bacterium P01_H01_bin.121]